MTTSVPQFQLGVPATIILEKLAANFNRMYAEALRTKDIGLLEHTTSKARQAYEALKLRANDGEISFERLETIRRALEGLEESIARLKEAVG